LDTTAPSQNTSAKTKGVAKLLAGVSLAALLVTALGHGFLGTKALVEEFRKANFKPEWLAPVKGIWILFSVNLAFLAALVAAVFFGRKPVSSLVLANSIGLLLIGQGIYLFILLGVFPGAVLVLFAGGVLLMAARLARL
jgi:hypothetical protein